MSITEKDILHALKELRMSESERITMRSELSAYADLHNMPKVAVVPFNSFAFLGNIFVHSRALVASALAFVIFVTGTSATAFASESSIPGDVLYAVKIHVTEPVASVFAGTGASEGRFYARLAVKRVEEATMLEQRGAMTALRAQEFEERFTKESDRAEAVADKLETSGDYSASLAIRTELASELALLVPTELPAEVSEVRVMKKATSLEKIEVAEGAELGESEEISFRSVIHKRVAKLREVRAFATAGAFSPASADSTGDTPTSGSETGISSARTLLSGTSVTLQAEQSATSTASSSPTQKARALKKLLRVKHNPAVKVKDDTSVLSTTDALAPVENPARLVPASTIPGR